MHCNVNRLIGYHMEGTDGELGKVEEFYFDDQAWIIVYLVVKTGHWLTGRKVLISPYSVIRNVDRSGIFPVNLTREQIKHSPDIDTELPVSRQQELALHKYYPWQSYWETGFYERRLWGIVPSSVVEPPPAKPTISDRHLRSTHAITGYHIETTDGESGYLRDFIIDDETWHIEYLVVEVFNSLEGERVLVARKHIKEIHWDTSRVLVDLTRLALENCPDYIQSDLFQEESLKVGVEKSLNLT